MNLIYLSLLLLTISFNTWLIIKSLSRVEQKINIIMQIIGPPENQNE